MRENGAKVLTSMIDENSIYSESLSENEALLEKLIWSIP